MPNSLLSSQEITDFQNAVNDHFETFKGTITIHKTPKKIVTLIEGEDQALGYNTQPLKESIEYVVQNASFPAIIQYDPKGAVENIIDIQGNIMNQVVKIKVKQDARDYIMSDKIEKITFDDKSFKIISHDILRSYQGLKYYNFYLELVT